MPETNCPACNDPRRPRHTEADWTHHPYRGHGFAAGQGWSHPDLDPSANVGLPATPALIPDRKTQDREITGTDSSELPSIIPDRNSAT